jgi:hypothetical protein
LSRRFNISSDKGLPLMKQIDIEKLLQWALREELPKGRPVSISPWQIIQSYSALGTRVDVSLGPSDGLGMVAGTPHPDAEAVAVALDALPAETRLSGAECEGLLGHYAALDPPAVSAVAAAPFSMRALVIRCAVLAQRMAWDVGVPAIAPRDRYAQHRNRLGNAYALLPNRDGILVETLVHANGRGNYPLGSATPCLWHEPTIGQLLEVRAEYAIWHRALCFLIEQLTMDGMLGEYALAPAPISAAAPWLTGQPPARTVHRAAGGRLAKLALAAPRPLAGPPLESDIERRAREHRAKRHRRPPAA